MNPKVSLIIPVYKVEQYLPRCLESVAAQTYDNFETILVDDGSPDNCGKMCDEYAATHENVIVIHQENRGLSGARNAGLRAATGEYIAFIDSDDYVTEDYITYMMELIREFQVDIAVGAMVIFFHGKKPAVTQKVDHKCSMSKEEAIRRMLYGRGFGVSACAKCYKRALFCGIAFPEGKVYEELATTYLLFAKANAVAYGNKQIYFYGKRTGSISYQNLNEKNLSNGLGAAEDALRYMEENIPEAVAAARSRYAQKIVEFAARVTSNSKADREKYRYLRNKLRPIAGAVLRDGAVSRLNKLKIIAVRLGYIPTCALMKAIELEKKRRWAS